MSHSYFMGEALILAKNAEKHADVPVGAVIVKNGEIIAKGQNRREEHENSLAHAEIEAINQACSVLGSKYLTDCSLYVTLEPCPMCTGAIINSRIEKVIFGAYDDKAGCMGTMTDMTALAFNHKPEIIGGYMEKECAEVLTDFFVKLRNER